jgi:3'-phosphoadenosine 5'-phosphosulfate sulfotransferase (PAPS reductase)/FAD synthetase
MALIERDENGVLHVVALSGGGDSTCLAELLREREPRPYTYVCTPTGDELPEMFAHWRALGERFGRRILPVMAGSLKSLIASERCLPNFRMRFCTRKLKIEPSRAGLLAQAAQGPVISYVGLRADEEGRAGGAYDDIPGVTMRFPLREWGMDEAAVDGLLEQRGIQIPERTDCARCYHQQIGEWWRLWHDHRDIFEDAIADELAIDATYRTPGRDSWPTALKDLGAEFAKGRVPTVRRDPRQRDLFRGVGNCRTCTL